MVRIVRAHIERGIVHANFSLGRVAQILPVALRAGEAVNAGVAERTSALHEAQHVVERPIFKHHDNDMLNLVRGNLARSQQKDEAEQHD